jgi:ribosomal protein S14
MQRQPTPRLDSARPGHFIRQKDAIARYGGQPEALVDLSDLPSKQSHAESGEDKQRKERDKEVTKTLKLKSWDTSKVRGFATCWQCGKPRCIYSCLDEEFAVQVVQQRIESSKFVCGSLLFDEQEQIGKVLAQRTARNCESDVEKSYYTVEKRALKTTNVCIHCGSPEGLMAREALVQQKLTGGYDCYPILLHLCGGEQESYQEWEKARNRGKT